MMAEHGGWFKMYERVLNDPKVHELSETDRWRWVECLCIAAMYGDGTGRLRSLNGMAFLTRRSENDVETTMERLVNAGLIDRRPGGPTGSYWCVHDWEKWQHIKAPKGKTAEPPEEPRARETRETDETKLDNTDRAAKTTATVKTTDNDTFDRFKKAYPSRKGSQGWDTTKKRFGALVRKGTDAESIVTAASRYCDEVRRAGKHGTEFVLMAQTWINDRWREYLPDTKPKNAPNGAWHQPKDFDTSDQAWTNRLRTAREWQVYGAWSREKWGPAPGEAGCLIPENLMTDEDRSRKWRVWEDVADEMRKTREMIRELNG